MQLTLHPDKKGKYYWRLKYGNKLKAMHSESYSTKSNSKRAEKAIVKAMIEALGERGYRVTK